MRKCCLVLAVGMFLACGVPAWAGDLRDIPREIGRQPVYAGEPEFALAVFGAEMETRMWMVLDRTSSDAEHFDTLYLDLNGNGDLTDPGERITADSSGGAAAQFTLPALVDPNTGLKHTEFRLRITPGELPTYMFNLRWRGELKLGGGYPVDPADGYMRFARSVGDAPIMWFNGDGPFRFQPWFNEPMKAGGEQDLKLFLGQFGIGPNTFCAFQQHVLPAGEPVLATLIYTDQEGQQREAESTLDLRC